MALCPCQSAKPFKVCCQPLVEQKSQAKSPQALMRSRFSAYATGNEQYLLASWHPATRPDSVDMNHALEWLNLEIIRFKTEGDQGLVEFKATYRDGQHIGVLHEISRFIQEQGNWYYKDGKTPTTGPRHTGRNAPCPCGSGRKYKKCCG